MAILESFPLDEDKAEDERTEDERNEETVDN